MNNPPLVAPKHTTGELCCVRDEQGNRCQQPARFRVEGDSWDDYTHVCGDHVADVRFPHQAVSKLPKEE